MQHLPIIFQREKSSRVLQQTLLPLFHIEVIWIYLSALVGLIHTIILINGIEIGVVYEYKSIALVDSLGHEVVLPRRESKLPRDELGDSIGNLLNFDGNLGRIPNI